MSAEAVQDGIHSISDQKYAGEAQEAVKMKFGELGAMCLTWHSVSDGLNWDSSTVTTFLATRDSRPMGLISMWVASVGMVDAYILQFVSDTVHVMYRLCILLCIVLCSLSGWWRWKGLCTFGHCYCIAYIYSV